MKNIKLVAAAIAALAIGALAFADAAASNYIEKFTSLVATAEACAKKNDGSKAAPLAAQKKEIDALRKTVTLSTTQRFSDWRLNQRYDAAYARIVIAQKAAGASSDVKAKAGEIGAALEDATNQVKDSVNTAAKSAKDAAKTKVDEKVNETTNSIVEKIQEGAAAVTNALNNLLGGKKSNDD